MKIAFVVGNLYAGGAERVASLIANRLDADGHEVYIIVIASDKITYNISPNVKIIKCIKKSNVKGLGFINRVISIREELKNISPDVCISFTVGVNIYAVLANVRLKNRLVLAERNDPHYDPSSKIERFLRRILYLQADGYVFQTEGEKSFFSKRIQNKSVVIPNPLNPEIPEPYMGVRKKKFVTVGRLFPQKRIDLAIGAFAEACSERQDYKLEIYGDGPLHNELAQYIEEIGMEDRIILCGAHKDIYDKIKDAYGFILSSDYEGISNAMLEAMALGVPTISTDYPSGGAREFITNKVNGLLVPVGSKTELINAIRYLIDNPADAEKIGKNSAEIRKSIKMDKIINAWTEYICKMMA